MSHTQGPWSVSGWSILEDTNGTLICEVLPWNEEGSAEDHANAHLIAAAPDMLRALEAARKFISNGVEFGYIWMPEDGDPALETSGIIEAAIRKARDE